jgi:hypothetical protein
MNRNGNRRRWWLVCWIDLRSELAGHRFYMSMLLALGSLILVPLLSVQFKQTHFALLEMSPSCITCLKKGSTKRAGDVTVK